MHQLRLNAERTCGNQSYQVHGRSLRASSKGRPGEGDTAARIKAGAHWSKRRGGTAARRGCPERRKGIVGRQTMGCAELAERVHGHCALKVHRGSARPTIADKGIGPK